MSLHTEGINIALKPRAPCEKWMAHQRLQFTGRFCDFLFQEVYRRALHRGTEQPNFVSARAKSESAARNVSLASSGRPVPARRLQRTGASALPGAQRGRMALEVSSSDRSISARLKSSSSQYTAAALG